MKRKILWTLIIVLSLLLATLLAILFCEPLRDALPIDQSGWKEKDGNLYYLNEKGDPLTGWQEIDGNRIYFAADGALASGWQEIEGSRYFLNENGAPLSGWQEIAGSRYYLDASGAMVTGWLDTAEGRFYFNENGNPHTGWLTTADGTFFLDDKGNPVTGWLDAAEGRYYLDETGAVTTGWQEIDSYRYYLGENGVMVTGWAELEGQRIYLGTDGRITSGWQDIGGSRYYLDENGIAATGWRELEEGRYYFNEEGAMLTGWLTLEEGTYYLKEDGTMAKGRVEIDGETHYFTSTGASILLVNRWNVLPEDYKPEGLVEIEYNGSVLPECAEALEKLIAACKEAGFNPQVRTSYRDFGFQQYLLNQKVAQYGYDEAIQIVAIPGTSEHHTGLAVDIVDAAYTKLNHAQAERPTQKWLMEHCWEYGFIVRYPDGTTDITGIIYEPWHYRYVGVELALEMRDNGLCLEEYLDNLTNDGTTCGDPDRLK